MWRPRDRERFIGTYDPEHELPDPQRAPGDRWQSDAYRRGSRDSRYFYRMSPDRVESRYPVRYDADRDMELRWRRDARATVGYRGDSERDRYGRMERDFESRDDRDRYASGRSFDGYGYDRGYEVEPGWDDEFDEVRWRDREYASRRSPHWDRDRFYGSERGWEGERGWDRDDRERDRSSYERDFGIWERDRDRWRR